MTEKMDDEYALTLAEIKDFLEGYGGTAGRKSIYDDFETLRILEINVMGEQKKALLVIKE